MTNVWAERSEVGGGLGAWLDRMPLPSLLLAVVVLLALAVAYVASAMLTGSLGALVAPEGRLGLAQQARYDLVMAILVAYTIGVSRFGRRRILGDLERLRPLLTLPETDVDRLFAAVRRGEFRLDAVPLLLGAAFGIALELGTRNVLGEALELGRFFSIWGLVLNLMLFALLGRMSHLSLRAGRILSQLGREHTEIRLLDADSRYVFAQAGLRAAAFWFVGSSIASLLVFEAAAPWLVIFVLALTLAVGVASLTLPTRGIHRAVREAKQAELAWVRRAVVEARAELTTTELAPERSARLPALLAYEARIDAVREWPFDSHVLLRFSLFLLLPLGSWIGGALVERLVDVLLG